MTNVASVTGSVVTAAGITTTSDAGACGFCTDGYADARWAPFTGGTSDLAKLLVTITCENGTNLAAYNTATMGAGFIRTDPHLSMLNCDGGTKLRYRADLTSTIAIPDASIDILCTPP